MNIQTANGKSFINNKPLDDKYIIDLVTNTSNPTEIRFVVKGGSPTREIFSCDYQNLIIDHRNPDLLIINAPNFYGEFSDDNCVNISYTHLINGLNNKTKLVIKNEVLVDKYTILLLQDGSGTGTYFLSIQVDNGGGLEEVASVSYTDMLIDSINPNKTIISSPTFYAELTANNCTDFRYSWITSALR
jgi:hypothetical protein